MKKNINIPNDLDNIFRCSSEFDPTNMNLIKKHGVVFTKRYICDQIIRELKPNINDIVCEPSVGKGIFVFSLLEYFRDSEKSIDELVYFVSNNLHCFDINIEFIEIFKSLLKEYFKILGYVGELNLDNIRCDDFLLFESIRYDVILGNPPYIRIQNLSDEYVTDLKLMGYESVNLGNIDIYYAFIEKALKCSEKISFIIPNSFLKNKTGSSLRSILNDKLYKIIDNGNDKVWENISTYTCIIFCDRKSLSSIEYISEYGLSLIDKSTINWFDEKTNNILHPLLSSVSGGIATLRDAIFKFDSIDGEYVIKGDIKVEREICREVYKATTKKIYWFIYPYINNEIIPEEVMIKKYPLAYNYLLKQKDELNKRDGGNIAKLSKYDAWYAYGRKQGLYKEVKDSQIRLILPLTFLKGKAHYKIVDEQCLAISGISVILNKINLPKFESIVHSNEFHEYLERNNKILFDKDKSKVWLTLNTTTLKKY